MSHPTVKPTPLDPAVVGERLRARFGNYLLVASDLGTTVANIKAHVEIHEELAAIVSQADDDLTDLADAGLQQLLIGNEERDEHGKVISRQLPNVAAVLAVAGKKRRTPSGPCALLPDPEASDPDYFATRPGGAHCVFTWDLARKMVAAIRRGCHRETAASIAGVSRQTLCAWLRRGAKGEEPFARFAEILEHIEAQLEQVIVSNLARAALNDPKIALEWLARRFPERHNPQHLVYVKHEVENAVATPAMARAIMAELFPLAPPENDAPSLPPARESGPEVINESRSVQAGGR